MSKHRITQATLHDSPETLSDFEPLTRRYFLGLQLLRSFRQMAPTVHGNTHPISAHFR